VARLFLSWRRIRRGVHAMADQICRDWMLIQIASGSSSFGAAHEDGHRLAVATLWRPRVSCTSQSHVSSRHDFEELARRKVHRHRLPGCSRR
jgi:hypothetical protein